MTNIERAPLKTSRCTVERMRAVSGGAGRWKCMGSKDQFFSASAGSSQVTAKSSVALCTNGVSFRWVSVPAASQYIGAKAMRESNGFGRNRSVWSPM